MAHFAKLGANSKVIQVLTMDNEEMKDSDGKEIEALGQQWLERHNNWPAQMWIQTSYNTVSNTHKSGDNSKAFRGNYAGIGYLWDEDDQIFWPRKPFSNWVKNYTTANWESPIGPAPELTEEQQSQNQAYTNRWHYVWNEDTQAWDLTDDMV